MLTMAEFSRKSTKDKLNPLNVETILNTSSAESVAKSDLKKKAAID